MEKDRIKVTNCTLVSYGEIVTFTYHAVISYGERNGCLHCAKLQIESQRLDSSGEIAEHCSELIRLNGHFQERNHGLNRKIIFN